MNELAIFDYDGMAVRAISINGDPWFVARDVATILGYVNPQKAVRDHCKRPQPVGVNDSFTLDQQTVIIPESDVYRLILRSNLPAAESFENWLMEEVLPAIRKTGAYTPATLPDFSNPAEAARAWADQFERRIIAERTKAQIGERREATAMNTASQAIKKVRKLEEQLDHLKEYCSIKRMSMIYHGIQFDWRELKAASAIMGLPPISVFDVNYQNVNAYHRDVWQAVYAISAD